MIIVIVMKIIAMITITAYDYFDLCLSAPSVSFSLPLSAVYFVCVCVCVCVCVFVVLYKKKKERTRFPDENFRHGKCDDLISNLCVILKIRSVVTHICTRARCSSSYQ